MMLRLSLAIFLVMVSGTATLRAQAIADTGSFVVRHRQDTVATERFTRTATRLEGTLALRNVKRTFERYRAVVAPDATLPLIEVTVREGADSADGKSRLVERARVIFKDDSVAVDQVGNTGLVTRVFKTELGAVPYLNLSCALLEQAVRRARAANGGAEVAFFNLGGGQTVVANLSGMQADSVRLDIGDTRIHLLLDRQGRLMGGRIPMQDLVFERQ